MSILSRLKPYYGDIKQGKLQRLPFVGYYLLLVIIMVIFALSIAISIGLSEHIIGGDLAVAQERLRQWLTIPFMVFGAMFTAVFCFSFSNIIAKRLRDIGLPGWTTLLILLSAEMLTLVAFSDKVSTGVHSLIFLLLVVLPSRKFNNTNA